MIISNTVHRGRKLHFFGDKIDMKSLIDKGLASGSWADTPRPNAHSTKLSRFTEDFKDSEIQAALEALSPEARAKVTPALYAFAELQSNDILRPWAMALGGNTLAVSCAGGWKEREGHAYRFTIPAARMQPDGDFDDQLLKEHSFRAGFAGPFGNLFVDDTAIWGAGDERIKAFDIRTGKLVHTLSCGNDYTGMFGIHDDIVFRANSFDKFACWKRADLKTHAPVMGQVGLIRRVPPWRMSNCKTTILPG